jgi:uncharacterized membrane protein YobD (UPF0266 family)
MKSISIQIPNDKAATYQLVTFIIAIMNLAAFAVAFLNRPVESSRVPLIIGTFLGLLLLLTLFIQKRSHKPAAVRVEILFIVCGLTWLFTGAFLIGVLLIVFGIMGFITLQKKLIHFSKEGIKYPSFPLKWIPWQEIDFVVLKDDVLTIEMKNNRLMQFTLEKNIAAIINPEEFNHFCRQQLAG